MPSATPKVPVSLTPTTHSRDRVSGIENATRSLRDGVTVILATATSGLAALHERQQLGDAGRDAPLNR